MLQKKITEVVLKNKNWQRIKSERTKGKNQVDSLRRHKVHLIVNDNLQLVDAVALHAEKLSGTASKPNATLDTKEIFSDMAPSHKSTNIM